jgi:hypothetical protein
MARHPFHQGGTFLLLAFAISACGGEDSNAKPGGSGGDAGAGGNSGSGGAVGTGASAGSGGSAGGAGAVSGGAGGVAGSGGSAGSPSGGAAGGGGTGGSGDPGSSLTAAPYNCVCDGKTNASSCIQSALNDHAKWKNRTLEFPQNGTCIAVSLQWNNPIGTANENYVLRGNGATLKAPDAHPVVSGNWILRLNQGRFLSIDDLNFDGNRQTRTPKETVAHSLFVFSSQDVLLHDVDSLDAVTDGIYVGTSDQTNTATYPKRITIQNPIVRRAYRNNISIINCDNCHILGDGKGAQSSCQLTHANGTAPEAGIDFEPNKPSAMPGISNSRVEGCYVAQNEGRCIMLSSRGVPVGTIVRGNTMEDCRYEAPTCGAALTLGHKGALVENNVIKNFKIKPGCRSLIDFGANPEDTGATVRNNQIQDVSGLSSTNRILYIHGNNGGGHTFKNNTMTNIGVGASGDWCQQGGTVKPSDIADNKVDGQTQSPNPGCP